MAEVVQFLARGRVSRSAPRRAGQVVFFPLYRAVRLRHDRTRRGVHPRNPAPVHDSERGGGALADALRRAGLAPKRS